MKHLAGWDGPECITEGIYRYSKTFLWKRLYIDAVGNDFYGGIVGACRNFEVEKEDDIWKCYPTDLAQTPKGELIIRLRGGTTWDIVYERCGAGMPLDDEIVSLEDLAAYLERCMGLES